MRALAIIFTPERPGQTLSAKWPCAILRRREVSGRWRQRHVLPERSPSRELYRSAGLIQNQQHLHVGVDLLT